MISLSNIVLRLRVTDEPNPFAPAEAETSKTVFCDLCILFEHAHFRFSPRKEPFAKAPAGAGTLKIVFCDLGIVFGSLVWTPTIILMKMDSFRPVVEG